MTNPTAAYTRSYNVWCTADAVCESYAQHVRTLRDYREEVAAGALLDPKRATSALAAINGEVAAAVEIQARLWQRRMAVYQEHRALVKKQSALRARKAAKVKGNGKAKL